MALTKAVKVTVLIDTAARAETEATCITMVNSWYAALDQSSTYDAEEPGQETPESTAEGKNTGQDGRYRRPKRDLVGNEHQARASAICVQRRLSRLAQKLGLVLFRHGAALSSIQTPHRDRIEVVISHLW